MFEDPSNLFVVDLATSASEVAGVPPAVQVMACLFLGCCCLGFPSEQHDDNKKESTATAQGNESSILQRRPFLSMIDSRIGLNRFTETLKKPLIAMSKKSPSANLYEGLFHLPGFKAFYETQVESIRNIIFELYSGPTSGVGNGQDSAHSQVIALQQEKIKELEDKVEGLNRQLSSSSPSPTNNTSAKVGLDTQMQQQFQQKQEELEQKVQELQQQVVKSQQRAEDYEDELQEAAAKFNLRNQEAEQWQAQVSVLQGEVAQYQQKTQQDQQSLAQLQQALATKSSQVIDLESSNQRLQNELQGLQGEYHAIQQRYALLKEESDKKNKSEITSSQEMFVLEIEDLRSKYQALQHENECLNDELLRIKGSILSESQTRKQLQDLADQKERKLQMLESELTATRSLMDSTEAKKQEVKEKNVELVDLLKAKEEFIAQLQLQMVQWQEEQQQQQGGDGSTKPVLSLPSPIIETKIERVVEKVYLDGSNVLEALLELITSLALQDQEEVLQIAKKIHLGEMKFDEDTIGNVAQVLSACKTVIVDLAGECSDMAEGLRILHLQGAEGSVERIRDCFQQCMNQIASLQEAADTIPDLEVLVEELQSSKEHCLKQIEHLQESIQTHKDVNADLHRELSSKDCQIASFASTTASFEQQASQEMQLKQEMLANEKLLEDLNKTQHDIEDQEKAIAELSTTKSVLEGVVQALKQQLEEMQKQSLQSTQNLQNEVQVLKQALQNKEQEISTAWKSKYDVLVQELDIERNGRQHEKDQMQQEVSRAQQQQAALSKHVLEVEEELKHATLQQQRQVQQVQDQHDEISKLQQLLQGQHQTHHKEAEQYKLLLKSKQEECAELQEEIKKLSKASTYVLHPQDDENFSDVQRLQEQEMKRLSHLIDRYQRELAERDAEIREIKSKLSVKEGEVAGLRTAMQVDIQENKTMRQEIDNLQSKCTKEQQKNRSLQDDIDMLQEKIQRLTTLDQTIHSVRSSPAVKSRANNTVSFTGTSRRSQADTEDELGGSLSHMMSSMMSSPAATPMKSSNYSHSNAATTVLGMGGNDENKHNTQVYHTPSNQHHETDKIIITNSGRKLVEAQSVIKSASPAAKEAARLNAEVLKEVSLLKDYQLML